MSSWHVTDTRGRDGEELGSVRSIVDPGSGAKLATDSSAKVTRNFTAGRLDESRRAFEHALALSEAKPNLLSVRVARKFSELFAA